MADTDYTYESLFGAKKKKYKNDNVEKTAAALDQMLVHGIGGKPATLQHIKMYLKKKGFVKNKEGSIISFTNSLGQKYGLDQNAINGMLVGAKAEIMGLVDQIQHGGTYEEHYRNNVLPLKLKDVEEPLAAAGAEAAGAIVPTLALGIPAELKLAQKLGSAGKATALVGAGEGAVAGAMSDTDALGRLIATGFGAGLGGVSGAIFYKLTDLLNSARRWGVQKLGWQDKEKEAAGLMMEDLTSQKSAVPSRMSDEGRTYAGAGDAIKELDERRINAPGSKPIIADLGENTRLSATAVIEGMDPKVRAEGLEFLDERQLGTRRPETLQRTGGQGERLTEAFFQKSGIPEINLGKQIKLLQNQTLLDSRAAYNTAYRVSDATEDNAPDLVRMMDSPEFLKGYQKGYQINRLERQTDPNAPQLRSPKELRKMHEQKVVLSDGTTKIIPPQLPKEFTIAELDYAQRGYRANNSVRKRSTTGEGMDDQELRAHSKILDQFNNLIGDLSPEYTAARRTYAFGDVAEDALNEGSKIMNKPPKTIANEIDELSEGERKYYKLGAASSIYNFMEKQGLGRNLGQLIDEHPDKFKRLEVLFGTTDNLKKFMRQVITEMEGTKTRGMVKQSQTARVQAAQKRILGERGAASVAPHPTDYGVAKQTSKSLADIISSKRYKGGKEVATQLGSALVQKNPAEQRRLLRRYDQLSKSAEQFRRGFTGGGGLLASALTNPLAEEGEQKVRRAFPPLSRRR